MPTPPHALRPICLAGPTAIGKSAVALALAQRLPLEIISVDSAQVYRGLDLGTAKPTPEERQAVPHHLIDIRAPWGRYSAAEFATDARACIAGIQARGRVPLLVGGTLLYFKALLQGLDDLPPANPAVRARIDQQAQAKGWPALHALLAEVDAVTAARLAPSDSQRIQRALEVWHITGQALSSFHTTQNGKSPYAWMDQERFFALYPHDRAWLHQRIAQRFDAMLTAGLQDEVRALHADPRLHAQLPAMRCVGYRQAWDILDGRQPADSLRARGTAATRQLAKRQLTWLRKVPDRQVLTVGAGDTAQALAAELQRRLP